MVLGDFIHIAQMGIQTSIMVSAPVLLMGLIAGVSVSIFQAATQITDASLAFIPKIGAAVLSMMLFGGFMISKMSDFIIWTYSQIPSVTN